MSKRFIDLTLTDEEDNGGVQTPRPPRKRAARAPLAPPLPLYKASVKDLATSNVTQSTSSTADIDNAIILRIKKCLDRANHPNTPQAEAKAALHLSSRLMAQYNVSQAEVLAHEPDSVQKQYAGQSVVSVQRLDEDKTKRVTFQNFVSDISDAMAKFFDCDYYSTQRMCSIEFTFYGIAENTVTAAMAFEMTYNLVAEWARPYKGNSGGTRNSYCIGVADELRIMAYKEKRQEEARARKAEAEAIAARVRQEEAERLAALERLAVVPETRNGQSSPTPAVKVEDEQETEEINASSQRETSTISPSPSGSFGFGKFEWSDGQSNSEEAPHEQNDDDEGYEEDNIEPDFKVEDDDDINTYEHVDNEISKLIKPERVSPDFPFVSNQDLPRDSPAPVTDESNADLELVWRSHTQLITFRKTALKIAEDYLTEQNTKLYTRQSTRSVIRDSNAYAQGTKDAKKIDVHGKRIKNEPSFDHHA